MIGPGYIKNGVSVHPQYVNALARRVGKRARRRQPMSPGCVDNHHVAVFVHRRHEMPIFEFCNDCGRA